MYSYDGEAQDGFEEDSTLEIDLNQNGFQNRVLNEFIRPMMEQPDLFFYALLNITKR